MKKRISMNCVSYLIISIAIIFSASASAQTNYANLWNEISEVGLNTQGTSTLFLNRTARSNLICKVYHLH